MRFALMATAVLAAVAIPGAGFATTTDLAAIETECGTQLKMPPGGCACIKGKAATLSDNQQAFIVAMVTKNKARQNELMQGMTVGELTEAGKFMASAPAECGNTQ